MDNVIKMSDFLKKKVKTTEQEMHKWQMIFESPSMRRRPHAVPKDLVDSTSHEEDDQHQYPGKAPPFQRGGTLEVRVQQGGWKEGNQDDRAR